MAAAASAAVLVVAITGIAVTLSVGTGPDGGSGGPVVAYPSTQLADAQFAALPGQPGQGALPTLAGVAAVGSTVVAVGSQATFPSVRPLILTSADGGHTWEPAMLRAPGGGVAAGAGAVPVMVAGGSGGWLALGTDTAWTSKDGRSWQLGRGIAPLADGDRVLALAQAGNGFVAVGENVRSQGPEPLRSPVLWTSSDGLTWQRQSGSQLGLAAGRGQVVALRWAAAHGSVTMIGGEIVRTVTEHRGKRKVTALAESPGVWRTGNGGRWVRTGPPVSHGATGGLDGLAATGSGFVAIRPGHTAAGIRDAVAYVSDSGRIWRFAGALAARRGGALRVTVVGGSDHGAVAAGSAGGHRVAFVTGRGWAWHQTADLGRSSARSVTGVTVGPAGKVVAAGASRQAPVPAAPGAHTGHPRRTHPGKGHHPQRSSSPRPGAAQPPNPRPFLLLARWKRWPVGQAALADAITPGVTVNSLGAGPGEQVAVGSVNGAPAIWSAPAGGHWSRAAAAMPASWHNVGPGLTSVVHGNAGWLAIGGEASPGAAAAQVGAAGTVTSASASASRHPVLMTSPDGQTWQPAAGAAPFAVPGVAIAQAAAGPSGYVVVGDQVTHGQRVAALWWSADLTTWIPQGWWTGYAPTDMATHPSALLAVAAGRAGFAAVGAVGTHPAVWLSRNGQGWSSLPLALPPGADSAVLQQVAIQGSRITAIGTEARASGPVPFAAVSANGGSTWRETVLPATGAPARVTALVGAGSGFVAAGTRGAAGIQEVILWWSLDGSSWHAVQPSGNWLSGPAAQQISGLAVSGTTLSGVGYTVTRTGQHPTLWLARVR